MNIKCQNLLNKIAVVTTDVLEKEKVNFCLYDPNEIKYPNDSGWMFFTGHETGEENSDIQNYHIIHLKHVLEYNPSFLEILNSVDLNIFHTFCVNTEGKLEEVFDWNYDE